MKPVISRKMHGLVSDYPFVAMTLAAPYLFKFKEDKKPVMVTRVLASAALISALTTKAEWSPVKAMPYKGHVVADFALGVLGLAAPWVLGFGGNKRARNTVLALGATGVVVGILSGLFGGMGNEEME